MPQSHGHIPEAGYPRVIPAIEESQGAVLPGVVEGNSLLQVLSGWD
jgi:hypothetical protein